MDRERQRNRAPFSVFVENELGLGRTTAGQRGEQLETPVVLVGTQDLPATFVVVPVTPNPIAAAELGWKLTRRFVKRDDGGPFRRRVTHGMPDRLHGFARVGRVCFCRVKVEDRTAANHLGKAVWLGRIGSRIARRPRSAEFEDRQPRPVAEPDDCPFHTEARLFPEDPGGAEGNRTQRCGVTDFDVGKWICFANNVHASNAHTRDRRAANSVFG